MQVFMIILSVLAGLLLLIIFFIFTARFRATLSYSNKDSFNYIISILGIRIINSKSVGDDRVKVRLSDYSKKKLSKKNNAALARKKKAPKPDGDTKSTGAGLRQVLTFISDLLIPFVDKYSHVISVRAARLYITVATDDAANTAILYGTVIQSVAYLLELLRNFTRLEKLRRSKVCVRPDFTATSFSADIKLVLKAPLWLIVVLYIRYLRLTHGGDGE